jgi:hypothetical protein
VDGWNSVASPARKNYKEAFSKSNQQQKIPMKKKSKPAKTTKSKVKKATRKGAK